MVQLVVFIHRPILALDPFPNPPLLHLSIIHKKLHSLPIPISLRIETTLGSRNCTQTIYFVFRAVFFIVVQKSLGLLLSLVRIGSDEMELLWRQKVSNPAVQ